MSDLVSLLLSALKGVWSYIVLLSPFKLLYIEDGEIGVRYRNAKPTETLRPGLHCASTMTVLEKTCAVGNLVNLDSGVDVYTSEGVPMLIHVSASYDIEDFALFNRNADVESLLGEALEHSTVEAFSEVNFKEAAGPIASITGSIQSSYEERVRAEFGIRVRSIMIAGRTPNSNVATNSLVLDAIDDKFGPFTPSQRVCILSAALPVQSPSTINTFETEY